MDRLGALLEDWYLLGSAAQICLRLQIFPALVELQTSRTVGDQTEIEYSTSPFLSLLDNLIFYLFVYLSMAPFVAIPFSSKCAAKSWFNSHLPSGQPLQRDFPAHWTT